MHRGQTLLCVVLVLILGADLASLPFLQAKTLLSAPATTAAQHLHQREPDEPDAPEHPREHLHVRCLMCLLPVASLPKADVVVQIHRTLAWAVPPYELHDTPGTVTSTLGARGPPA